MTSRNGPTFKVISILAVTIATLLISLTGCGKPTWTPPPTSTSMPTATDTPTPSPTTVVITENSVITLPDGSIIVLKPGAEVEISELPGLTEDAVEVKILIKKGEILVAPAQSNPGWLSVISTKGYVARIKGCAMIVSFSEVKDSFDLQCIGGECEIGKDIDHLLAAASNKNWLYQGGIFFEPVDLDFDAINQSYGKVIPACVKTAKTAQAPTTTALTSTPKSTVDTAATATAACAEFNKLFPATPCPNTLP